jgi:hypothetical protein
MSARRTPRLAITALLLAGVLGGCAIDPRTRVRWLEDDHRKLSMEVQAAEQAVQAASAYSAEMASPEQAGSSFSLYFSPAMLEQLSTQALPYQMSAKEFHSQLTGTIILERMSDFRFLSRNRLRCRAHLRGVDVRYTGKVPDFAKKQVQDFQKAVASGAWAELDVQLTLDGNRLLAKAEAREARFRGMRNGSAERQLRDEMNNRALRTPFVFDMSIAGSSAAARRLMVTGNHVVVTYTP